MWYLCVTFSSVTLCGSFISLCIVHFNCCVAPLCVITLWFLISMTGGSLVFERGLWVSPIPPLRQPDSAWRLRWVLSERRLSLPSGEGSGVDLVRDGSLWRLPAARLCRAGLAAFASSFCLFRGLGRGRLALPRGTWSLCLLPPPCRWE